MHVSVVKYLISYLSWPSNAVNTANHVRFGRALCFTFVGDFFLLVDKAKHVRLPVRKRKSPSLYTYVGGLLLNLFLSSYSNLHILFCFQLLFLNKCKKKPAGRYQQNWSRLVFLFSNIKQLCVLLLSINRGKFLSSLRNRIYQRK